MKKALAVVLAAAMMALMLAACGSSGSSSAAPAAAASSAESEAAPAAEAKSEAAPAAEAESEAAPAAEAASASSQSEAAAEETVNYLAELVAMDDGLCLSGVQSPVQEDRSDIYKALDKVEKKDKVTVAFCGASLGADFFVAWERSMVEETEKRGWEFLESNAQFDIELQNTQFDAFVQQGVDVIILNALRPDAQVDRIEAAVNAGIPVILATSAPSTPEIPAVTTICAGSNLAGWLSGQYAAEQFYKPGEAINIGFALMFTSIADTNSHGCGFISGYLAYVAEQEGHPYADRYAATIDGMKIWLELRDKGKYDASDMGMNLVGYGQGEGTDAASGQVASSDLLTAHPEMDLIVVDTDGMVTGVISEIEQHSMVPNEDIKVICCSDGTETVCKLIKEGVVMASGLNHPAYYTKGIFACLDTMYTDNGGDFDINNLCANTFNPTEMITQDNVNDYYIEGAMFGAPLAEFKVYDVPTWNAENA